MIVDYYNILGELQDIEKNSYDNKSTMQKLKLLQKSLNHSVNRYHQRARAIPKLNFPQDLPISAKKQEIIDGIKNNQVIIITGETGSGKTTQIPKMCLAAGRGL